MPPSTDRGQTSGPITLGGLILVLMAAIAVASILLEVAF